MIVNLLKYNQIDKPRWDETVKSSYNTIVYAFSWYLDIVSPGWSALVTEDYQYIMPIPFKKKWVFKVALQPYFTQQLGIFSTNKITPDVIKVFLDTLSKSFSYAELNMNKVLNLTGLGYHFRKNTTFELDLIQSYDNLKQQFNENTKRNIKKSEKLGIQISENLSHEDFLKFFRENTDEQLDILKEKDYQKISKIINLHKFPHFVPLIIGAYDKDELSATAFFIKSTNKIIYLLGVSNQQGKKAMAMFKIIDYIIKKFANKNIVLDFEGSNIQNIARMYHGFGAKPYSYDTLSINNLPFFIKKKNRK